MLKENESEPGVIFGEKPEVPEPVYDRPLEILYLSTGIGLVALGGTSEAANLFIHQGEGGTFDTLAPGLVFLFMAGLGVHVIRRSRRNLNKIKQLKDNPIEQVETNP